MKQNDCSIHFQVEPMFCAQIFLSLCGTCIGNTADDFVDAISDDASMYDVDYMYMHMHVFLWMYHQK